MSQLERRIAGLTCAEVLADLSAYLDGELGVKRVEELRAHLNECNECSRFGATVGSVIERLRAGSPALLPDLVRQRVRSRVIQELSKRQA